MIRYVPSGKYYPRLRANGKLIVKSLKTRAVSVAKLRLSDLEKHERQAAEHGRPSPGGQILFAEALFSFHDSGFRPIVARSRKDAGKLKPASIAYYEQRVDALLQSWLEQPEIERPDGGTTISLMFTSEVSRQPHLATTRVLPFGGHVLHTEHPTEVVPVAVGSGC